jgi:hypothetical protein
LDETAEISICFRIVLLACSGTEFGQKLPVGLLFGDANFKHFQLNKLLQNKTFAVRILRFSKVVFLDCQIEL